MTEGLRFTPSLPSLASKCCPYFRTRWVNINSPRSKMHGLGDWERCATQTFYSCGAHHVQWTIQTERLRRVSAVCACTVYVICGLLKRYGLRTGGFLQQKIDEKIFRPAITRECSWKAEIYGVVPDTLCLPLTLSRASAAWEGRAFLIAIARLSLLSGHSYLGEILEMPCAIFVGGLYHMYSGFVTRR